MSEQSAIVSQIQALTAYLTVLSATLELSGTLEAEMLENTCDTAIATLPDDARKDGAALIELLRRGRVGLMRDALPA